MKMTYHVGRFLLFISLFGLAMMSAWADSPPDKLVKSLNEFKENKLNQRIFIHQDRDYYAPGETIWYSVYATNFFDGSPSTADRLEITIEDVLGNELDVETIEPGSSFYTGTLQIPNEIVEGIYFLNGYTESSARNNPYRSKFLITEQSIPAFIIEASLPGRTFYPADKCSMTISFKDHYNEPLKNVNYAVEFFTGTRTQQFEGKTDKSGNTVLNISVPTNLNNGRFRYQVTAEYKERTEILSGFIPVYTEKYYLQFYPEGGVVLPGHENKVSILVKDALGRPITGKGGLFNSDNILVKEIGTDNFGFSYFTVDPEVGKEYSFRLLEPFLSEWLIKLPLGGAEDAKISVTSKSQSQISLLLESNTQTPKPFHLIALTDGQLMYYSAVDVGLEKQVAIDRAYLGSGFCTITLLNDEMKVVSERTIILDMPELQPEEITLSKSRFQLREQVEISAIGALTGVQPQGYSFSAALTPWLFPESRKTGITDLRWPVDFYAQLINYWSDERHDVEDIPLEAFELLLSPEFYVWDHILGNDREEEEIWFQDEFLTATAAYQSMLSSFDKQGSDSRVVYRNTTIDQWFLTHNPDYLDDQLKTKHERVPYYKKMLDAGSTVREALYSIRPYEIIDNKIVYGGIRPSVTYIGGAFITIDGAPMGEDISVLDVINPIDVETIRVDTSPGAATRYTTTNSVGLIEIKLKTGKVDDKDASVEKAPDNFESPIYERRSPDMKIKQDFRKTLYWDTSAGSSGNLDNINFSFYTSDLRSDARARLNVVLQDGTLKSYLVHWKIE